MRPVFLFFIDGMNITRLKQAMADGLMPHFSAMMSKGSLFDRVMTSFPSVTGPAHVPLLTGEMPYHNDIVGHNNHRRKLNHYDNLLMYYRDFDHYFDKKKTVFESFDRPVSVGLPLSKGARYRANRLAIVEWGYIPSITEWNAMRIGLNEARAGADFVAVWMHEMDTHQHIRKDPHRVEQTFRNIDKYAERAQALLPKDTLFAFCTDHGNEWTPNYFPLRRTLQGLLRDPFLLNLDGGGYVQLFMHPKAMPQQLDVSDMEDITTTAGHPLLQTLVDLPAVGMVWARDGAKVRVATREGYATIERDGERFRYHPVTADVFHYGDQPATTKLVDTWITHRQSLDVSFASDFPDGIAQGFELTHHQNAADIILTNREGWSVNRLCPHSVHGGINREQMHSAFAFSEPVGDPRAIVHSTAFPHLLLEAAGRPPL